jgi:hypothetical protein
MMGYSRLAKYDDARRSMRRILDFARQFRLDNPLVDFGGAVYQPKQPINLCYDTFGAPAAMIRGLFEYLYTAEGVTLVPHVPPGITRLEQHFPIRFGRKRLYLATAGSGPITGVVINGKPHASFDAKTVSLPYETTPDRAVIQIALGGDAAKPFEPKEPDLELPPLPPMDAAAGAELTSLHARVERLWKFNAALVKADLADGYEAAHARLAVESFVACVRRQKLLADGALKPLPAPSEAAADQCYAQTTARLCEGLEKVLESYGASNDPGRKRLAAIWAEGK